jgi:hypothetical protein
MSSKLYLDKPDQVSNRIIPVFQIQLNRVINNQHLTGIY